LSEWEQLERVGVNLGVAAVQEAFGVVAVLEQAVVDLAEASLEDWGSALN
jgi:hypothetical protein